MEINKTLKTSGSAGKINTKIMVVPHRSYSSIWPFRMTLGVVPAPQLRLRTPPPGRRVTTFSGGQTL
ncbi:hypothetical protein EYF80_040377 [Liparis tanakae]|uniref:Uncharacterized protein n=1 Tax=Liparis tanakae TaxID=230148 RepID=A0A4Z2GA45_9TELE|nr:hypothetical protein EYF80_040377 [Liparis tanakae]